MKEDPHQSLLGLEKNVRYIVQEQYLYEYNSKYIWKLHYIRVCSCRTPTYIVEIQENLSMQLLRKRKIGETYGHLIGNTVGDIRQKIEKSCKMLSIFATKRNLLDFCFVATIFASERKQCNIMSIVGHTSASSANQLPLNGQFSDQRKKKISFFIS